MGEARDPILGFETMAVSVASLSCERTPRPTKNPPLKINVDDGAEVPILSEAAGRKRRRSRRLSMEAVWTIGGGFDLVGVNAVGLAVLEEGRRSP